MIYEHEPSVERRDIESREVLWRLSHLESTGLGMADPSQLYLSPSLSLILSLRQELSSSLVKPFNKWSVIFQCIDLESPSYVDHPGSHRNHCSSVWKKEGLSRSPSIAAYIAQESVHGKPKT